MDLSNQALNGFSAHLAVSFNPDIFETNIINITLLLGGIIYLGSSALSESLSERQEKIVGAIQEAEERLQQADLFEHIDKFFIIKININRIVDSTNFMFLRCSNINN